MGTRAKSMDPDRSRTCGYFVPGTPLGLSRPSEPDDFRIQREHVVGVMTLVDTHGYYRRIINVCGAPGTKRGVGKTTLLQEVHRRTELQEGGTCVAVQLESDVEGDFAWMRATAMAVKKAMRERLRRWQVEAGRGSGKKRHRSASCDGLRNCKDDFKSNGAHGLHALHRRAK